MGAAKRINTGDYEINTFKFDGNPLGNVNVYTHTFHIEGNLEVVGITTNVQAYNTILPVIHVNYDEYVAAATIPYAGLQYDRGVTSVGLYFMEDGASPYTGEWIANNSAGQEGYVLTSYNAVLDKGAGTPGPAVAAVVLEGADPGPGESGVYTNAGYGAAELVNTKAAKKYAIIFG